jgi:hypothetical protein
MLLASNKLLLRVCQQFLAKQSSSIKNETIPQHHTYAQTSAVLSKGLHAV